MIIMSIWFNDHNHMKSSAQDHTLHLTCINMWNIKKRKLETQIQNGTPNKMTIWTQLSQRHSRDQSQHQSCFKMWGKMQSQHQNCFKMLEIKKTSQNSCSEVRYIQVKNNPQKNCFWTQLAQGHSRTLPTSELLQDVRKNTIPTSQVL